LVFNIFSSLAEFERDLIRERTNAGLNAARARCKVGGRDKRKKKRLVYKEARLCLSYKAGDVTPVFAATISDVNTTGKYLRLTAQKAGLGINSQIHTVGDGAQWIVKQLEEL